MNIVLKSLLLSAGAFLYIAAFSCPAQTDLTFREILDKYYQNDRDRLYIGCAPRGTAIPPSEETKAIAEEFAYITPDNHFKQTHVHPEPGVWSWGQSDAWVESARQNGQIIRMHGPISPQCSKWAKEDTRKPEELETNMREYMTELCRRYNKCADVIKWMDVINEIYTVREWEDKVTKKLAYHTGDWFGPLTGTTQFQNPWPIIGYDETSDIRVPLYIKYAFEIATKEAPDLKHIINCNGLFEQEVWDNMKKLVMYLRGQGYSVDGVGWQAHVSPGWEKVPGNIERLGAFIDWCHENNLEFHITELNIWSPVEMANDYEGQAETFTEIVRTLVKKRHTGVVAIDFWYMRSADTLKNKVIKCSPWAHDGTPLPAVESIKRMLIEESSR